MSIQYVKFEVNENGHTAFEAFLKAKKGWRELKEDEYFKLKLWNFDEWGTFASESQFDFIVSPRGKVYKFHSFFHFNTYVYDVVLKSLQGLKVKRKRGTK